MRELLIRKILVASVSIALVATMQPVASAHHRPDFYCSESGDLCQSTRKVDGVRKLGLLLAAKYFGRYELCVVGPMFRTCDTFRVRELDNGLWGRDVRWRRHFGSQGEGSYAVAWYRINNDGPPWEHGTRIGEKLGFHVR